MFNAGNNKSALIKIIRYTFNKELMMENGIVMEDVYLAINEYDSDRIQFIYFQNEMKKWIVLRKQNVLR